MNWVVRHIFGELYGLEITDVESIRAADQAVQESAADPSWPRHVADKLAIRRICIHDRGPREFKNLPGVSSVVPIDANQSWGALTEHVVSAPDRCAAAEAAAAGIEQAIAGLALAGITCMRAPPSPFEALGKAAYREAPLAADATRQEIQLYLGHALYRAMSQHAMVAQLFVGVEPTSGGERIGVDGTQRIPNLHGLFATYPGCRFELIVGAEGNNLDAVQAARVYRNVYVGGMWWYNFRASTYRQSMQYRFEALPSTKCSLVVSDARCIEWCFGKILLIKRLMADFLSSQVAQGWLDAPGALRVARDWLHDSAAALYAMPGKEGN
jgi:glucuronate isomerase